MPDTTLTDLINSALDSGYKKSAGTLLNAVTRLTTAPNSQIQRSLKELDEEAQRLAEADKRMATDNAVLLKTLAEYAALMAVVQSLIRASDDGIQASGQAIALPSVTAKVFIKITGAIMAAGGNPLTQISNYTKILEQSGIKWNMPRGAVAIAADYVNSAAWASKLDKWGEGYAALTKDTILKGIQQGAGPRAVASQLRQVAQGVPYAAAENLTRTLQLTSYREASLVMEQVNGAFIKGKIRIAKLDDRTCLSCIALHGTPLKVGERVDDHYRGRCSEYYQVPGGDPFPGTMQADSLPGNRRFVPFQTGEAWFASLPADRQAQQASFQKNPAKFRAYRDGVALSDFVGDHTDDVFGSQKVELSLLQAVGQDAAQGYYTANQ